MLVCSVFAVVFRWHLFRVSVAYLYERDYLVAYLVVIYLWYLVYT
jgi:hypothetical protein